MSLIDGRRKETSFYRTDGRRVYAWKIKNKKYTVGVNGTSHHYMCQDKYEAELRVGTLLNLSLNH